MNKTYTTAEIEEMQQRPVGVMLSTEKERFILHQREVIRQLLSRVQEYQEVVEMLKIAGVIVIFNVPNRIQQDLQWTGDEWELIYGAGENYFGVSNLHSALKELTKG